MPPDIQSTTLHRINQQRLAGRSSGVIRVFAANGWSGANTSVLHSRTSANNAGHCAAEYRRHYQIQLSLLQGGLRVKCHADLKSISTCGQFLWKFSNAGAATEYSYGTQWRCADASAAVIAGLQCLANLWQHLVCQLQQISPCGVKRSGWLLRTNSRKQGVVPDR